MSHKVLFVYLDEEFVGELYINNSNGKEVFSFSYDDNFLINHDSSYNIDVDLGFYKGVQYQPNNKLAFGFIEDICPDRWGRNLIKRNEHIFARLENRPVKTLLESDYLINVSDISRMGNIRIKNDKCGEFLGKNYDSVPKWVYLNKLEQSVIDYESEINVKESLLDLLSPGSSLGGARPKANVFDNEENIWIAKFPSKTDEYDVGLLEKIANDLAKECGIDVPENKIINDSKYGSIFLTKRFDRIDKKRIRYASACSLLGARDGESSNYSYLDIVGIIKTFCKQPQSELNELFKRIAFNIFISNVDNHLRNLGFIFNDKWELSPMFDINFGSKTSSFALNIDESGDNSINHLVEISRYFFINKEDALNIVNKIKETINLKLPLLSKKIKLSNKELAVIESAIS